MDFIRRKYGLSDSGGCFDLSPEGSDGLEHLEIIKLSNHKFLKNLKLLYQRRINSSFNLLDRLKIHLSGLDEWAAHAISLELQLKQNLVAAENEIKLKKQQLIMEIERLYERAMKDLEIQIKVKNETIQDKIQEIKDKRKEVEQTIDMIKLKIRGESKQKFVKNYLNMIKEGEKLLKNDIKLEGNFEQTVLDLRIKAPFFNYMISQKNHKGELMSVSMRTFQQRHNSQDV